MRLRHLLIAPVVAAVGIAGVSDVASAAPKLKQSFTIVDDFAEDDTAVVLSSGAVFNLVGEDIQVSETVDVFTFPDGSITVTHAPIGQGKERFNPNTCAFSFSEKGTYVLTEGTGAYEGVTGQGTYTVRGEGQGDRLPNGECDPESAEGQIIITAKGTVNPGS